MSKEIVSAESLGLVSRESNEIDSLTKTSEFLPQLRIFSSASTIVKEGKFPIGHFGLYISGDNIVDLGDQTDCLVIDWRPRASSIGGDTPISFFGKFNDDSWEYSPGFTDFKDRAMSKQEGYVVGLEYLIYFPTLRKYGLFLMGNPTLRRESANVKALVGKAATFKIKLIKTAKFSWHGCTAFECSTPFDVPGKEDILREVNIFRSPKDSDIEFVDDSQGSASRAR